MSEEKKTLTEQLLWLGTLMVRDRARDKMCRRRGFRRGQSRVLAFLKIQSEVTVKELAYVLDIHKEMLSAILKQMEEDGLVEIKVPDDDDGLEVVRLTEKGSSDIKSDDEQLFDCLSDEEKTVFFEYIKRLTDTLEAKLASQDAEDKSASQDAEDKSDGDSDFAVRFNWKVRGSCGRGGKHERPWVGKDIMFHGKLPHFPFPFRRHF